MTAFPPPPAWSEDIATAGVTGTNGKTTTTEWLAAAAGDERDSVASVTTVGSKVGARALGVAEDFDQFLAVLAACHAAGGKRAAIELTSAALGAGFLRGWPCRVGVFTNLSLDHLDMHGSAEHYLASKAQLFAALPEGGHAVLNACDSACTLLAEVVPKKVTRWSYAVASRGPRVLDANLTATSVELAMTGTRATIATAGLPGEWPGELQLRAIGEVFAENALAALLGAVALGTPPLLAARRIEAAEPPPGRFQLVRRSPLTVVDYAHSPDAMRRTLATARSLCRGRVHVVFGAGGGPTRSKRKPLGDAARGADSITLTSDNPRDEDPKDIAEHVREGLAGHPDVHVELDRVTAIERALGEARDGDLVLVAGKGHERTLIRAGESEAFSDAEVIRAWSPRA